MSTTQGRRGRASSPEAGLDALAEALASQVEETARRALASALANPHASVVKRAADSVRARGLTDLTAELSTAFARLLVDPVKADPGCHAKLAILEALDFLEHHDEESFLLATRHIQREPSWGPPVDTAVGVRARGIVALARLGYTDLGLLAAELMNDRESPVRQATADALAHRGTRENAGLLLFKLRLGDDDPMVVLSVMNALLALAPDWALPILTAKLSEIAADDRELSALALGQSRRAEALDALLSELERCVRAQEREPLFRALGLHRSEQALSRLLHVISNGSGPDARAALAAVALRRFEPGVPERVQAALANNASVDLRKDFEEAFGD